MADQAYSGALMRAAHFAHRPPVPGVSPEHEHPEPERDYFSPAPEADPGGVSGDVFQPEDISVHTEMQQDTIDHWGHLQAPVPSSVPREVAGIAATARMLQNHGRVLYRPDTYAPYKHAEQGRSISFTNGRLPWQDGETVSDEMAYLVMGKNAYDQTQQPNEVYSADQGRYRMGVGITDFGLYQSFQKVGQDAELRAYTGLAPDLAQMDKPILADAAPYTPNVSGSSYITPAFQVPSMFALPSETSLTDYEASTEGDYWQGDTSFLETDGY
ncbi:hypothetical protein ACIPWE_40245 [Streptomyces sp. NPDC090073]|uniref:hypothetical protein n=1 Tax=Streptomyces sp. NPDC090073 TaxID=3365936 RepID=UPI00381DEBDE